MTLRRRKALIKTEDTVPIWHDWNLIVLRKDGKLFSGSVGIEQSWKVIFDPWELDPELNGESVL